MSRPAIVYRILVVSPSNMVEERKAISEVIQGWNSANSYHRGMYLEPFLCEAEDTPQIGGEPPTKIDEQLVKNCDMLIGIFWTRLNIEKEIKKFREAGKPVLLCFSSAPVILGNIDAGKYRELLDLKIRYETEVITFTYGSINEFREQLQKYVTLTLNSIHIGDAIMFKTGD